MRPLFQCNLHPLTDSGWFWFTVLTTIGYGNQAPETDAGRAMIYSLGFLSILMFAGILATAGFIAAAIVDDTLVRSRLVVLTRPCLSWVFWGILYYGWMAAIAAVTVRWKRTRLGPSADDFTIRDGYWFGYISSTTVGLGDIFLEPEVFLYRDLVTFPLLFLVAFVLVAAFLSKFAELIGLLIGKKSLVEDLVGELKTVDMVGEVPGAAATAGAVHKGMDKIGEVPGVAAAAGAVNQGIDGVKHGLHLTDGNAHEGEDSDRANGASQEEAV